MNIPEVATAISKIVSMVNRQVVLTFRSGVIVRGKLTEVETSQISVTMSGQTFVLPIPNGLEIDGTDVYPIRRISHINLG